MEHVIWSLISRSYMYMPWSYNQSSCVFTEGDQQSITAVKVAGQQPYILLKRKQSLSITHKPPHKHTHTFFLLPSFDPVPAHFSSCFNVSWSSAQSACWEQVTSVQKCLDVLYSGILKSTIPYSHFKILKRAASICVLSPKSFKMREWLTADTSSHWPMRLFLRLWFWILLFSVWQGSPATREDT